MQHWLARTASKRSPYRLYALSNTGSLLGLLSYPFLVEPNLGLLVQGWAWAAGYGLFLVCYYFCARSAVRTATPDALKLASSPDLSRPEAPAGWRLRLFWIGLSACASVLLLATTNLICQNIAVSPFLWVLQLSLYLISFIICFENDRWYRREIFHPLFAVTVAVVIAVSLPNATYSFLTQLAAYSAVLFAGCMVCHGEAACTRPSAESLTVFYFSIATGGVVGGIVVGLVAPWMFPNYWEYPLGVLGCMAVVLYVSARERSSWWYTGRASLGLLILGRAVAAIHRGSRCRSPGRCSRFQVCDGAPRVENSARANSSPQRIKNRLGIAHGRLGDSAKGRALPRHRFVEKFLWCLVGVKRRRPELFRTAVRRYRSWVPVSGPPTRSSRDWLLRP